MLRRDDIELFVRETLGCACPDEVFERIDCRANINLPGGIELDYRITVGGRLLIFALNTDRFDCIASVLPLLTSAGIADRDNGGFNRFRPDRLRDKAFGLFESLAVDDRTHLHVVAKDDFPIRCD